MPDDPDVPGPVRAVVKAVNAGDSEAFVTAFHPDGVIDDWGQRYDGTDGIATWARTDAIGQQAQMTPRSATTEGVVTTVAARWESGKLTGDSDFVFTVDDGLVRELRIPPSH